jgi:hypothetical protein
MKNIFLILFVSGLLASCASAPSSYNSPNYTKVSKIFELKSGMTQGDIINTLGVEPFDIYTNFENGYKVLLFKYKQEYQKVSAARQDREENLKSGNVYYKSGKESKDLFIILDSKTDRMITMVTSSGRGNSAKRILKNSALLELVKTDPKVQVNFSSGGSGVELPAILGKKK